MFVKERFILDQAIKDVIYGMTPKFGYDGFGELIFYRTYSRDKKHIGTGFGQENWADTVIRCIEGTFSIRKDWYLRNYIPWDESFWQHYAMNFGISLFNMQWMPPGRGLWAMGTPFIYERGSMALNNCGYVRITNDIGSDIHWMMDSLMMGVGVGFMPIRDDDMEVYNPHGSYDFIIEDSREGWCDSVKARIDAFLTPRSKMPRMIYDKVRPAGLPIRGFGGISSGPEPLMSFHKKIDEFFDLYACEHWYDSILLKADLGNVTGCCVVAGNVRRSAELCGGDIDDPTFLDLKNYKKFPYREVHGWMSNNSVILEKPEHFEMLGEIAKRVVANGEPGYVNRINMRLARVGRPLEGLREDMAEMVNPCGEQPLEDHELCCLCETLPTMCESPEQWLKACEYATVYASTVTLLPTHRPETNKVMARNRRIGVGIIDFTGWKHNIGMNQVIKHLRNGYKIVRSTNSWVNSEAGIPEAIRVTTVKPGGTVPKIPGKTSGAGFPTFIYTLRRFRLAQNSPLHKLLVEANIPYEKDYYSANTDVFEFPIVQGPAKPAEEASLWEQAFNLITLQREWSDNAVSNTLYFKPKWILKHDLALSYQDFLEYQPGGESGSEAYVLDKYFSPSIIYALFSNKTEDLWIEKQVRIKIKWNHKDMTAEVKIYSYNSNHEENDIETVLSSIAPHTKSVSLLPHSAKGVYVQMPEEGITKEEYLRRRSMIKTIDWSKLSGSDGEDERYCMGPSCEIPR